MLDVDGSVELAERDEDAPYEVIGLEPAFFPPGNSLHGIPSAREIDLLPAPAPGCRSPDQAMRTPRSVRASPSSALTTACEASSRKPEATLICVIPGAVAVGRYMHSMAPIFWQPVQELEGLKR